MTKRSIVVISAGLRVPSTTRMVADELRGAVSDAFIRNGHEAAVEVIELRDHAHAIADAMLTGFPSGALEETTNKVVDADGIVVVTPTFSASYSGLFKSFIDIIEPEALTGMPVLMAATGGSERHSLMLDHALRPLFSYLGAEPVRTAIFAATADFGGAEGAKLEGRMAKAAGELARAVLANPVKTPRSGDVDDEVIDFVPFDQLMAGLGR